MWPVEATSEVRMKENATKLFRAIVRSSANLRVKVFYINGSRTMKSPKASWSDDLE